MSRRSLLFRRQPLLSLQQLARIEDAALRILDEIGIAVLHDGLLQRLRSAGFRACGDRVMIEPHVVHQFLAAERAANGGEFSEEPQSIELNGAEIRLEVSPYPQSTHDLASDSIVPFTTDRLIEAAKLVHMLSARAVGPRAPGCPRDVPPPLQPVVQYWVGASYCQGARDPVDPKSRAALPYVVAMAEVLGRPVTSLPVYVSSPLTLGSESLQCVLQVRRKLSSVSVSNMASLGCSTPINVGDAYALLAAEVIGTAILLRELIHLPIRWSVRLCPIDLRNMAMCLGSPEDFLLQLQSSEVNAYFHGTKWHPAVGNVHSSAKLPGSQACSEKASLMTAGALLGQRRFGVAGTLSLDEVFSAEQLVYDVEIRDHVHRMVAGMGGECDPDRCVASITEALRQGNFAALDDTLGRYRDVYWHPALFERGFLAKWQAGGEVTIRQKAQQLIRELLGKYDWELEPELQRALDGILARARSDLT